MKETERSYPSILGRLMIVILFSIVSTAHAQSTFIYDTWDGIPEKISDDVVVRLKAYCKHGQWRLNAISNPINGRVVLSKVAKNYLHSLQVPNTSCTHGESIGSAFWFVSRDIVLPDGEYPLK